MATFGGSFTPYRIGLGSDLMRIRMYLSRRNPKCPDWRGVRYTLRSAVKSAHRRNYWGIWQSEADGLPLFARRGITPAIAERRMRHDAELYALGRMSSAQRRRLNGTDWGRRVLADMGSE